MLYFLFFFAIMAGFGTYTPEYIRRSTTTSVIQNVNMDTAFENKNRLLLQNKYSVNK